MKKYLTILALSLAILMSCDKDNKKDNSAEELKKSIKGIECVLIKSGTFWMGVSDSYAEEYMGFNDAVPLHEVKLTKDFYLGKYEVTNAQFCKFLNDTNVEHYDEYGCGAITIGDLGPIKLISDEGNISYKDGKWVVNEGFDNYPVVCVSWYGANEFCRWAGGKLPTEAQWEYACRAGTSTTFFFGEESGDLGKYAWYDNNSNGKLQEVGKKNANPWGLYDIYGNVNEWCSDYYYQEYYVDCPAEDPERGPHQGYHIFRGGSYKSLVNNFTAFRNYDYTENSFDAYGFRFCYTIDK